MIYPSALCSWFFNMNIVYRINSTQIYTLICEDFFLLGDNIYIFQPKTIPFKTSLKIKLLFIECIDCVIALSESHSLYKNLYMLSPSKHLLHILVYMRIFECCLFYI